MIKNPRFTLKQVSSGFLWKWLERTGTQFVQFVVQIILARILMPEEYGLVALVAIFILFAEVFVQSGLNTSLIQKKTVDDLDINSAAVMSILVAIVLYCTLFFLSPFIADFYNDPRLVPIIRVLSIKLLFGAINSIQLAVIAKNMDFKLNFVCSFIAVCVSGGIGIIMAINGSGVWALVYYQLVNQLVVTILLWFLLGWRPKLRFSIKRIFSLFTFGSKVLGSNLVALTTEQLYGLLIGKIFNSQLLGYFYRGQQFPLMIGNNVNGTIKSVLLPVLSSEQDDLGNLKKITRRSISLNSFIVFPAMAGLAAIANPLVIILLTDKWLPSVPFILLECLFFATMPLLITNVEVGRALGRSEIGLKLEIIKMVSTFLFLIISVPFGIYVMLATRVIISIIIIIISAKINEKLIGYTIRELFSDIYPPLLISGFMGLVIYHIHFTDGYLLFNILLKIIIGILLYSGLAFLFKLQSYRYLISIAKKYRSKEEV